MCRSGDPGRLYQLDTINNVSSFVLLVEQGIETSALIVLK